MKKIIYVVVVLAILLLLSLLLKGNQTTSNVEAEVVAPVAEVAPLEEGAVVVDAEPTTETAETVVDVEPAAETVVEDVVEEVVEENPSATADEGETVVE